MTQLLRGCSCGVISTLLRAVLPQGPAASSSRYIGRRSACRLASEKRMCSWQVKLTQEDLDTLDEVRPIAGCMHAPLAAFPSLRPLWWPREAPYRSPSCEAHPHVTWHVHCYRCPSSRWAGGTTPWWPASRTTATTRCATKPRSTCPATLCRQEHRQPAQPDILQRCAQVGGVALCWAAA